jgi:3D (Asp-Asp-Asp) domain-containing protein/septal ring factor EnvC (AmiA/AmiB activator)
VLASRLVRGRLSSLAVRFLAFSAAGLAITLALGSSGAGAPSGPAQRAQELRTENASLADRRAQALLGLYSLDSQLARARSELAAVRAELEQLARQRQAVHRRLVVARHSFTRAQVQLAQRVRGLYEHGTADPVAIVLGAQSLSQAIETLDGIRRVARHDETVLREARAARAHLAALARELSAKDERLHRAEAAAAARTASLAAARAQRASFLARLSEQQRLNAGQIRSLESAAAAAEQRSERVAVTAGGPPAPAPVAAPTTGARALTVTATGYSLQGTTSTGLPAGWGVAAVDPSVIPLGTRMTIPGYGDAVAADTGSAIQGLTVDLWFPTIAQALAWGRRAVTVTLH